jgi:hypothetical protein
MPHITTQRGATGAAIFSATTAGGRVELFWLGAGSGLFLLFGGNPVRIEHRSADGQYATLVEARKAATAFIETLTPEPVQVEEIPAWSRQPDPAELVEEQERQSAVDELNRRARESREANERAMAELVDECRVSFDIHWCDTHNAVKPEGMRCTARSIESAQLVKELDRQSMRDMENAHAHGYHADLPREGCPECRS